MDLEQQRPSGWWGPLIGSVAVQVTLLAVVSRIALAFAGWYSLRLIPPPWDNQPRSILAWAQWDADHYARIAHLGYVHPTDPGSTAFFPLYPLLVRGFGSITSLSTTRLEYLIAGVIVAGFFFVTATYLLTRLFEVQLGADRARTAGVLFVVSPFSFFLTAGYTESLFLTLVGGAFLLVHRKRWYGAAVVVAFATATRVTGVFLIPALLFMMWRDGRSWRGMLMVAGISPLGLFSYMAYTWYALDDPIAFLTAQQGWGGFQDRTWIYVQGFLDHPLPWFLGDDGNALMLFNAALFFLFAALLVPMVRTLPPGITIFSALIVAQSAVSIQSMGRYLIAAIGVYMVAAILIHRSRHVSFWRDAIVLPSAVVMTFLFLMFAQAEWIV